jgi:fatty-acyl-CoA synthase
MRNRGVGSWAQRRARMSPGRIALVDGDREWTYRDVYERSTRLAHVLAGSGIGPGDRVAYLGPNHPTFLETLFAAGMLGAVFVPLNTRLAVPELAYILRDCAAAALMWAPQHAEAAADLRARVDLRRHIGLDEYEDLLATAPATPLDEPVDEHAVCMIMYTSGTTGRPKGAMLTHANIAWNSFNLLLDVDVTSTEVTLVSAPMFHVAALNLTVLPTFLKGGRCVLVQAFEPAQTLDLIERHGVTYLFGVPAMFLMLARAPRWAEADLSSLRSVTCGGAPVPEALISTYQQRGLTFMQGYGLSEASPGVLFLRADDSTRKIGSAGTPVFFGDVRVVQPDGTPVEPGEPGEILAQGPNVMAGYWQLPAETAEVITADGWLRTGDIAITDGEGYLYIRDRVKDLIISGGENIYPAEVEDLLYKHPAVAECAVIGVPDDRWGEVGRAVVVLRDGVSVEPAELLDFMDGRIARYKIPKSVVFVDALPRTGSGKVLKKLLHQPTGEPP